MSLLLCAATFLEIQSTIDYLQKEQLGIHIDILITGVGISATTYQLTKKITTQRPSLMIQAGIAGSIDRNIDLLETTLVRSECIGDSGALENNVFKSLADLGLANSEEWPWKENKLKNDSPFLNEFDYTIVNGVTVNQITTDKKQLIYYQEELETQIETLEGAALHYTGLMENIPFLQLRNISNYAGERSKKEWKLEGSIKQLNLDLQQVLLKLSKL
jgi:futalosine hydrolase